MHQLYIDLEYLELDRDNIGVRKPIELRYKCNVNYKVSGIEK